MDPLTTALAVEAAATADQYPDRLQEWVPLTPEIVKDCHATIPPEYVRLYMANLWADHLGTWDNGEPRHNALASLLVPRAAGNKRNLFVKTIMECSGMAVMVEGYGQDKAKHPRYVGDRLDSDYHGDHILGEAAHAIGISDMALPCKSNTRASNYNDSGDHEEGFDRWVVVASFGYGAPYEHHYLIGDGRVLVSPIQIKWAWVDWMLEHETVLPGIVVMESA